AGDGKGQYGFRRAQLYWSGDQYVQAIEQWRAIADADPKNVDAHMALGAAYIKIGEPVEGFREYQKVLALAPGHAGAKQALARMGTRQSSDKSAHDQRQRRVQVTPA